MDVIVDSERDRRTLDWLIAQVGEEAVEDACSRLAGQRKPYVSNVAKLLGLTPPEALKASTPAEARQRLAVIKNILKTKNT
jgi:hypothetical protein